MKNFFLVLILIAFLFSVSTQQVPNMQCNCNCQCVNQKIDQNVLEGVKEKPETLSNLLYENNKEMNFKINLF